jgi:hypothetical protein
MPENVAHASLNAEGTVLRNRNMAPAFVFETSATARLRGTRNVWSVVCRVAFQFHCPGKPVPNEVTYVSHTRILNHRTYYCRTKSTSTFRNRYFTCLSVAAPWMMGLAAKFVVWIDWELFWAKFITISLLILWKTQASELTIKTTYFYSCMFWQNDSISFRRGLWCSWSWIC